MDNEMPNNVTEQPKTIINIQVPSLETVANKRSLIPTSFTLAIIFFFFTFCAVRCVGHKVGSVTGINLVTGKEFKYPDLVTGQETKSEKMPASIWAIFAFSAAVIGLGAFLVKEKREDIIGTSAGIVGVCSLIILQITLKSSVDKQALGQIELDFQLPYWGALLSLGFAGIICYLRMRKIQDIVLNVSSTSNKTISTTENNIQTQVTSNSFRQTNYFDTTEWLTKNKKSVIGIVIIVVLLLVVYQIFLKHDQGFFSNKPSVTIPLYVSSLGSDFVVQGEFDGTCQVRSNSIELTLRTAKILVATHSSYKGKRLITKVRAGLARNTEGEKWNTTNMIEVASPDKTIFPGESISLKIGTIHIPIGQSMDLSTHWIVFEIEAIPFDLSQEKQWHGYSYVHSSKDIFRKR